MSTRFFNYYCLLALFRKYLAAFTKRVQRELGMLSISTASSEANL